MKKIALFVLFMATTALPQERKFQHRHSRFFSYARQYNSLKNGYTEKFRKLSSRNLLVECANGNLESCDKALAYIVHLNNLIEVEVAKKETECKKSWLHYLGLSEECKFFESQQLNYKKLYQQAFDNIKNACIDGTLDDHKQLVKDDNLNINKK